MLSVTPLFMPHRPSTLGPLQGQGPCLYEAHCFVFYFLIPSHESAKLRLLFRVNDWIPVLGRCLGGGKGDPLQYTLPGEFHVQGSLVSTVHGAAESWT